MHRESGEERVDLRTIREGIDYLYTSADREAARARGAHLNSVVRLTPYSMAGNIGSAVLMLWIFRQGLSAGLWLWFASVLAVSLLAVLRWWAQRGRKRETVSRRTLRRATWHAAILAGNWAVAALLWFPHVDAAQQLAVATLLAGFLGAGTLVLSPLPRASVAYAAIYTASTLAALWLSGNPEFVAVAGILCVYALIVVACSLSSWHRAAAQLRAQTEAVQREHLLAVLLRDFEQNADEALWETDAAGCLAHLSPRLATMLDVEEKDLRQFSLVALLMQRQVAGAEALQQALADGRSFRDVALTRPRPEGAVHLSLNGKCLLDEDGTLLGWRGVLADVSATVLGQRRLVQLAHTDSLTGLANRFAFREALAEHLRVNRGGALLTIDLDQFKAVNDGMGHAAGDELLAAVAGRLRSCVQREDLVARLGGDEFAVIMARRDEPEAAQALAQRLMDAVHAPVQLSGDRLLTIAASIGVAACDDHVVDVDDLLMHCDVALYDAKKTGRGCCTTYSAQLGERRQRRLQIEDGLRHAIEHGELALAWQPQVNIDSGRVIGAEALLRWQHPRLGAMAPAEFIAIAEQCGLIGELGLWVLREACAAAANVLAGLVVSVNVSPLQLRSGAFVEQVRQALSDFSLPPSQLEFELTESVFLGDAEGALEQLHELRSMGARIALDDFGTGYSSLAYLRRFPFDTLKIDRSFISEVVLHNDAHSIVQAISQMAAALGMRTICEGVESLAQRAAVAAAGCSDFQGYLASEPVPLQDFQRLRHAWYCAALDGQVGAVAGLSRAVT